MEGETCAASVLRQLQCKDSSHKEVSTFICAVSSWFEFENNTEEIS
jgi:hypothetical protein